MNRLLRLITVVFVMAALGACTTNVKVSGSFPTPLVRQVPLNVGVFYSEQFRSFIYEEDLGEQGKWTIDMGEQNLDLFRNMFEAMFASVTEVTEIEELVADSETPAHITLPPGLDGLIVPEIDKYGFLTPRISGLNFFSASIHYRLNVYDAEGDRLLNWVVVGYGKNPVVAFGSGESLGEATRLAIRDGGARIAIETFAQPAIQDWIKSVDR